MVYKNTLGKGFTLIEMLIVVVIIGILAAALIPRIQNTQARTRDVIRKKDMKTAADALTMYWQDNQSFPCPHPSTNPNWTDATACYEKTSEVDTQQSGGILSLLVPAYISKPFNDPLNGLTNDYGYLLYSTGTRYYIAGYTYPAGVKKTTSKMCDMTYIPIGIVQLGYRPEQKLVTDYFRSCPDGRPFDPVGSNSNVGHPENRFRGMRIFEDKVMAIGDQTAQFLNQ